MSHISYPKMSQETDALFTAFFALEDVRELLRESAPKHELDESQKKRLDEALKAARKALDSLEALK